MQLLDVSIFQIYKLYYNRAVDCAVCRDNNKFDCIKFFAVFQIFRAETFKSTTLQHVFVQTGIVSFNSVVIIDLLRAKFAVKQAVKESAITLLLQNSDKYFIRILQESESIKKVINYICNFYSKKSIFNIYSNLLFCLLRRIEKQTDTLKFVEKNLNKYLTATVARKERCQQCSTVVANNITESVTTRDCRTIVSIYIQQIAKLAVVKTEQKIQ